MPMFLIASVQFKDIFPENNGYVFNSQILVLSLCSLLGATGLEGRNVYSQGDAKTAILTCWVVDGGSTSTEALAQQCFVSFNRKLISIESEIIPLTDGSVRAGTIMSVIDRPRTREKLFHQYCSNHSGRPVAMTVTET